MKKVRRNVSEKNQGRPRRRRHNSCAASRAEKSVIAPNMISVQTKKKAPLELATLPPAIPAPVIWIIGTPDVSSDKIRIRMYPDRRSANTNVVTHSQKTKTKMGMRFENFPGANPRTTSSAW